MNNDHNSSEKQLLTSVSHPSNRPSNRMDFGAAKESRHRELPEFKEGDSLPLQGSVTQAAGGQDSNSQTTRVSRRQLERIAQNLTGRDLEVLRTLRKYRFMTSDQIGRLFLTDCTTKTSRTRNQNLLLKRLSSHDLIRSLWRRMGGSTGGSAMQVWYLAPAGQRVLYLYQPGSPQRKAFSEPSPLFLKHTLSVAETAVQLTLLTRDSHDLTLERVDTEPLCWRPFNDSGRVVQLKPDLFVVTTYEDYEDQWFIEMDLGTESSSQILTKCNTYLNYYYTGIEQRETQMFPMVLFIVPTATRKEKLKEWIRGSIVGQPKMFLIITPDELERTIRQMTDPKEIC